MQCGSDFQGVCSADDLVPGKYVLVFCLSLYSRVGLLR